MEKLESLLLTIEKLDLLVKDSQDNSQKKLLKDSKKYLSEYAEILRAQKEEDSLPLRRNTRWTNDEDERLKEQYQGGMTIAEICSLHRRTASGIVGRLGVLNLLEENAEMGRKHWTDEEEGLLIEEFSSGLSLEEMAQSHKRSMSGIIGRLNKLGYEI